MHAIVTAFDHIIAYTMLYHHLIAYAMLYHHLIAYAMLYHHLIALAVPLIIPLHMLCSIIMFLL
jgi:hypothetical protein